VKKSRALPFSLLAGIASYFAIIRRLIINWGATRDEINRTFPGDELTPASRLVSTHAITINAAAADIWPWIVQIGNGRAGWYSFRFVEHLVGDGSLLDEDASRRILPEFQNLQPGDFIPVADEAFKVIAVEPYQYLVLLTGFDGISAFDPEDATTSGSHSSFTFFLFPIDEQTTRLIARARFVSQSPMEALSQIFFLEPGHFVMQTKMLHGIKQRAEMLPMRH